MTTSILYEGNLRTRCTHLQSGTEIFTDAPKDNQGNGAAFSPTDLVATALGSCIVTTMGIKARQMGISIDGTKVNITKVMSADPRRISAIDIVLHMPAHGYSEKDKAILKHTAETCPVSVSLHPDMKQTITFNW